MLRRFSNSELGMIALALEEEHEDWRQNRGSTSQRRMWVHNTWKKRSVEGEFVSLLPHLKCDETKFYEYFRMSMYTFNQLEQKLQEKLRKQDTFWRQPVTPRERLAVCLRFLATGDTFKTISFSYRLGKSTVASIVHHTCRTIIDVLLNEVMPIPNEEMWKSIAHEYWEKWQFPNCIGALDGKHVTIQAPKLSGSLYWNYKKTFSIVILALVDPCYNFIAVDVGAYGRNSDGGILSNSNFGKALQNDKLNIPKKQTLPGTDTELPMVIVGDEAFALTTNTMRPYPGRELTDEKRIFNYRLSRARRLSENSFGILTQKFRIFMRPLQGSPENITRVVLAACILHNFIRKTEGYNVPHRSEITDSTLEIPPTLHRLPRRRGRATQEAFDVREQFTRFFNSPEGSVEWQEQAALLI